MSELLKQINDRQKRATVAVRTGDTVKVYQKIKEGDKERVQMFQGTVINTKNLNSHTASFTVRKVASGIGVEKSFLLHSPLITKIEITARGKVRRNFLTYMRERTGKSTRLTATRFDRAAANELIGDEEVAEVAAEEPAAEVAEPELTGGETEAEKVLESEEKSPEVQAEKADAEEGEAEPAE
jgi:large subunit ribosomal protein L19